MKITVQSFLEDIRMKNLSLVAGNGGLTREVLKVTVLDAPDGPKWLHGGEFILTSTYIFDNDPKRLYEFCEGLIKNNACAFGIKMSRYLSVLPQAVIDLCDNNCLPLVIIPYSYVWTDIISVFYEISYQLAIPEKYSTIRSKLVDKVRKARESGTVEMGETIFQFFDLPVMFLDEGNRAVHFVGDEKAREQIEEFFRYMGSKSLRSGQYFFNDSYLFYTGLTASLEDSAARSLILLSKSPSILDEIKDILAQCEIIRTEQISWVESEDEMFTRAIAAVAGGKKIDSHTQNNLNRRTRPGKDYYVVVCAALTDIQSFKANLSDVVSRTEDASCSFWVAQNPVLRETVGILRLSLRRDDADPELALQSIISEICLYLEENEHLYISDLYDAPNRLEQSYFEAKNVQDYCPRIWPEKKYCYFNDIYPYYLVMNSANGGSLTRCFDILERKQESMSFDCIMTLEAYLACGNYRKAAQELYLHENSMRYRIKKIGDFLMVDFEDIVECRNFMFRLNVWKLQKTLGRPEKE